MRAVLLVPRRNDGGQRDALWRWCRAHWERLAPDLEIVEGHHTEGPFNRSAAINTAARLAGEWDVALVVDSDVFLPMPHVQQAIESAATGIVTWPHRRWRGISEYETKRLLKYGDPFGAEPADGHDMDLYVERTTALAWSCAIAIPRVVFEDAGGFDERFRGWGFEDGAWSALIRGLYPWARIEGDVYHLFHPRSEERIVRGDSRATASNDYIRNALLGRRYMIAAIRDHAAGDQLGEERLPADLAEIHLANLRKDDDFTLQVARTRKMPEAAWESWWPTLEELRDGAKSGHIPTSGVTVIVHTGGEPDTWDERSKYLERSLASLNEMVEGPIVQRVLYSDWGVDRFGDLERIGAAQGFYVAGEGHHGFTESMRRMWDYLSRRARGEYVFAAEDDFLYDEPVDLRKMVDVLGARPHLSQLALLRHPYYDRETSGEGILGWPREGFEAHELGDRQWLEHRYFWTCNPALFRHSLTQRSWPAGASSEKLYGDRLNRHADNRFGFWGDGTPSITHIGETRAAAVY